MVEFRHLNLNYFHKIIDTQTTEVIETIQAGGKFALSICYSPDGELLAIGGMDGIIKIFSTSNYELMKNIEGHAMPIRSLAFSADSQFMMSASDDGHIKGSKIDFYLSLKVFSKHYF